MHVRTWTDDGYRRERFYDQGFFVDAVRRLPPDVRVFVASDDQQVVRSMREEFGEDRILAYPCTPVHTHAAVAASREQYEDALIELLLLARNRVIIGSAYSTFTEVAYYFARATLGDDVAVHLDPNVPSFTDSPSYYVQPRPGFVAAPGGHAHSPTG